MTDQKYVAKGSQSSIWHLDRHCDLAHETELIPVEEGVLSPSATACTHCAGGLDAQQLRQIVKEQ